MKCSRQLLLFPSFPLSSQAARGRLVAMREHELFDNLPGPPAGKPLPHVLSRKEALAKFRVFAEAYRILGSALLTETPINPDKRAELLSIMAIVKGMDGP